jgi:glycosyltransferase involved in cell wall biosynthesis
MKVLAWPARSEPYTTSLYEAVEASDPTVEVQEFRVGRSWRARPDLVHLHWPETAVQSPSLLKAATKSIVVVATLVVLRARGARIVWTLHNLRSHEGHHPRLESALRRAVAALTDGVVHLSDASQQLCADRPELASKDGAIIPLVDLLGPAVDALPDRTEARQGLGISGDLPVLAAVGLIRPYKNLPELIEAFGAMTRPAQLVIAGRADDEKLGRQIERMAERTTGVHLLLRWLSDEELAEVIRAADAVIAVYRDVHNSAVVTTSLALDRPVAINPVGSLVELHDRFGPSWIHPVPGPLTGAELDRIVDWARLPRPAIEAGPGLAEMAGAHLALYRRILGRSPDVHDSPPVHS